MSKKPGKDGKKMFFYESFSGEFDSRMNMYDCTRRIEIIFDTLLEGEDLRGRLFLDAGCGTGHFSRRAAQRGARVVSLDVGPGLLGKVKEKCSSDLVTGDILNLGFGPATFDYVLATEVIEHTADPEYALVELIRVLKSGGTLVVTVPNRVWYFAVFLADTFRLRPYEGFENWMGWRQMRRLLQEGGAASIEMRGFHLFPFIFQATDGVLRYMDRYGKTLGPVMLNMAVRAVKE